MPRRQASATATMPLSCRRGFRDSAASFSRTPIILRRHVDAILPRRCRAAPFTDAARRHACAYAPPPGHFQLIRCFLLPSARPPSAAAAYATGHFITTTLRLPSWIAQSWLPCPLFFFFFFFFFWRERECLRAGAAEAASYAIIVTGAAFHMPCHDVIEGHIIAALPAPLRARAIC